MDQEGGGRGWSTGGDAADRARRIRKQMRGSQIARRRGGGDEVARLARVEQQLAELQAEVAELKGMLTGWSDREGGRDLPGGGMAAQGAMDMLAGPGTRPAQAEVVLTLFAAPARSIVPAAPGGVPEPSRPAASRRNARVYVVVGAPSELDGWASGRPSPLWEDAQKLVEGVRERLSLAVAQRVVDVGWIPELTGWQVIDFGGFDRMAGLPTELDDWGHAEAGAWAARLGTAAGLPAGVADGAAVVIRYLVPLPFDRALHDVSRAIQVAGIVVFALSGGHVLACASLKSLIHDEITDLLAKELRTVIWPEPATPGPSQPRDPGRAPVPAQPSEQPPLAGTSDVSEDIKQLAREILGERTPDEPDEPKPHPPPAPAEPHKQPPGDLEPGGGGFGFSP